MEERNARSGIDFVVTWVDGGDPAWQAERNRFCTDGAVFGNKSARFRDWDLFRFWFRGVEKFAPWVDRVHLVTWGHVPAWLDVSHPKLNVVRHDDFIPAEFLPTFNSHTIELNMHRIPGLSDRFVYFNDDVFLLDAVTPRFFFDGRLPRDYFGLDVPKFQTGTIAHIMGEDLSVINDNFRARDVYRRNRRKMLAPSLGIRRIARNLALRGFFRSFIPGFGNRHAFMAFNRETFEALWEREGDRLRNTCSHRFRTQLDVSVWAMRYWQLATGRFFSASPDRYRCKNVSAAGVDEIVRSISRREYAVLCVNDNSLFDGADAVVGRLRAAFAEAFPRRSAFELNPEGKVRNDG